MLQSYNDSAKVYQAQGLHLRTRLDQKYKIEEMEE